MRQRPGWERLRGGCGGVWRHVSSGWLVRHCGHPTALWPYSIHDKANSTTRIAPNGHGFRKVVQAQEACEEMIAPKPQDGYKLSIHISER